MDYNVVKVDTAGEISFTSGDAPERTFGLPALIQEVLLELLSDFDERTGRGCSLVKNITDIALQRPQELAPVVSEALRTAQTHIIANQSSSANRPPEERLSSLELVNATLNMGAFNIELRLINFAGQQAIVTVPV